MEVQNTGQDGATGTTFTDVIPEGTAFVPGSIELNGAPLSDAADDASASSPAAGWWCGSDALARAGTLAPRARR